MTEVILFHHALGVTDGVKAFADRLRDGGHQVTVADLFGGATFDNIEEGVAYEENLGWDEMVALSEAAIAPLPREVAIGGFSLGAVLFLYPGSGHLFTDRSWEEYDEASTTLVLERALAFLDRVGVV
jgi:dienelactone hydrolase